MGVVRGWKIWPVPSRWTQSNVSAFVLPFVMPLDAGMSDDETVSHEDLARQLVEIVRIQADALAADRHALSHALDVVHEWQRNHGIGSSEPIPEGDPEPEPEPPRHQPQNPELRTWAGLRRSYQRLEGKCRTDLELKADEMVTMQMIWEAGGPSPRTTKRILKETFLLDPDAWWPPSLWPAEQPAPSPGLKRKLKRVLTDRSHPLGFSVAAAISFFVMLDLGLDDRLDGTLNVCLRGLAAAIHLLPRIS